MRNYKFKPAFSMIELIFVIVILGIVASIGSEIIVKVYEQYIVQRAQHRATMKTELAATQIANRLASVIPGTVYRIKDSITGSREAIDSDLTDLTGDSYIGLQWVGSDTDSFSATATPGWSGFIDLDSSSLSSMSTPGSNLANTIAIVSNLSAGTPEYHLYFPYDSTDYNVTISGTTITPSPALTSIHMVEHYKLAWTSYALIVDTNGDLYLYYDFAATPAVALGSTRSLLMKNISTFKFKGAGRTLRFKICREEPISADVNITSCKEKAVF